MGEDGATGTQVQRRGFKIVTNWSKFAIGERAELIITPSGNVLWDLIPFLDQETVDKV